MSQNVTKYFVSKVENFKNQDIKKNIKESFEDASHYFCESPNIIIGIYSINNK